MRLVNVHTRGLEEHTKPPPYAILSHTWGPAQDEVLYIDMINETASKKQSYIKIEYSCKQAKKENLDYVWIDTCCIDKSSSAELSEAINSMYAWYSKAEICYAFLPDVAANSDLKEAGSRFRTSRWFSRGWTLQELLAPSNLVFFSAEWASIGKKQELSFILAEITGIDESILTGERLLESASVAKRMSWAAHRQTTRPEDIAYCLMGIFNVNMPMLYGEGDRAFLRLQEEIMKLSDDQSLFAWLDLDAPDTACYGLLATSPSQFAHSNSVFPYQDWEPRKPFAMAHRGLAIDLHLTPRDEDIYAAAIDCPVPPSYEDSTFLAVYLKRLAVGDQQFMRVRAGKWAKVHERGTIQSVYVRQTDTKANVDGVFPQHIFQLAKGPNPEEYRVVDIAPMNLKAGQYPQPVRSTMTAHLWDPQKVPVTFRVLNKNKQAAVALILERDDEERVLVMLGTAPGLNVGFTAVALLPGTNFAIRRPQTFEHLYEPVLPGTFVNVKTHRVKVDMRPMVHDGSKYYMVSIEVEALERILRPTDLIKDIMSGDIMDRDTISRVQARSERKQSLLPWKRTKP